MDWYYIDGIEPRGPHELDDLLDLAQKGTIVPTSLVWNQHLPSWQAFSDVTPPPPPVSEEPPPDETEITPPASGENGWYFIHDATPYGPVSQETLHTLAEEGVIDGDSAVWRTDLPGWLPFSVTLEEESHPAPPPITQTTLIALPDIAPDTEWFYIVRSEPDGPVDVDTLHKLYHLGTVQPQTLIWHHGAEGWLPYREVLEPPEIEVQLPGFFDGTEKKTAPPAEMAPSTYGELPGLPSQLSAARKRVNRHSGSESPPAGFFIRAAAYLVDIIFVHLLAFGIGSALVSFTSITPRALLGSAYRATSGLRTPGLPPAEAPIHLAADQLSIVVIAAAALSLFYYVFLVSLYGATPGKRLFRYHLADKSGKKIGLLRAAGRHIGGIAIRLAWAGAFLLLGFITSSQITPVAIAGVALLPWGELTYLWVIWDKQKRALHDHLAGTYVLRD